ncbi:MAG TPA: endo-1,4-beta-xylanase [Treponemataceae bacterium]|nr:endo-1,4-beta-xylanase [Treponemataceae bacterium]
MKRSIALALGIALAAVALAGCGATPRKVADKKGLTFGVAIKAGDIYTPETVAFIKKNFNTMVPEDSMKWVNIRPKKDFWNWSDMDAMVAFAEKNKMRIKGHCFLWQDQNGAYVHSLKTREEAIALLTDQITTVMTRYKGRVFEYDIANEVFMEDGSLRDTIWYRLIGDDFLDIAFRAARAADPKARLILCDYNAEYANTAKGDAMYETVKGMKERGVPIDAVAHQLHCMAELPVNEEALRENIRRFEALGVATSFSEVDVRVKMPVDDEREAQQVAVYSKLLEVAMTEPGCKSFIMWGFSDKLSWIPRVFPGYGSANILDKDMKPKKAYDALIKTLMGK